MFKLSAIKAPHFTKNQKIAIVGAGPAGIHMAYLLKKNGYNNVMIFEKSDRIGGMSYTKESHGVLHEAGTCYLTHGYHRLIKLLTEEHLNDFIEIPAAMRKSVLPDHKIISFPEWLTNELLKFGHNNFLTHLHKNFSVIDLITTIYRYNQLHQKIFGNYEYDLPQPSPEMLKQLDMSFFSFLNAHGFEKLIPLFMITQSTQGYGFLDTVPALYGLWWNSPALTNRVVLSLLNSSYPVVVMLKCRYQTIWQTLVNKYNIPVTLNCAIDSIERSDQAPYVTINYHDQSTNISKKEFFDFIIFANKFRDIPSLVKQPTQFEIDCASKLSSALLIVNVVNCKTRPEGEGTITRPDCLNSSHQGEVYGWRNTSACTEKHIDPNKDSSILACQYYVDKNNADPKDVMLKKCLNSLNDLHVDHPVIEDQFVWDYFPHFDNNAIQAGYPWKILSEQGTKHSWYIGSSVCFETINTLMNYNHLMIDKYL